MNGREETIFVFIDHKKPKLNKSTSKESSAIVMVSIFHLTPRKVKKKKLKGYQRKSLRI